MSEFSIRDPATYIQGDPTKILDNVSKSDLKFVLIRVLKKWSKNGVKAVKMAPKVVPNLKEHHVVHSLSLSIFLSSLACLHPIIQIEKGHHHLLAALI